MGVSFRGLAFHPRQRGTGMQDLIDLMVVVDTQTILADHPAPSLDADAPTALDDTACYLVARNRYAADGQATANLHLQTQSCQQLIWRISSLSGNAGSSAVLYRINESGHPTVVQRWLPVPILDRNPPAFAPIQQTVYFFRTPIGTKGTHCFDTRFYITKPDDEGQPIVAGYFEWAATLTVS
jgi:hypothetical protein